jgi:hypothetical protein
MASGYTLIYYGNSTVNKSITVPDGEANTLANLSFPGRNFSGYGSPVDQNFMSLAENFASSANGPANPVVGQFWFDAANSEMTYNGALDNDSASGNDVWRGLLYRTINRGDPTKSVVTLAKIGNVVVGNISNTDPNNRVIRFDAGGSGNISTTGNLIIGDNGDGSDPVHGNLVLSDNGNIDSMGNFTLHNTTSYYQNGVSYNNIEIGANGVVKSRATISAISEDANGNVLGTATIGPNGAIYNSGTAMFAQDGNSLVTIGNQSKYANNQQTNPSLVVYGDFMHYGNFIVSGATTSLNATTTTIKDSIIDIGALDNNAPLVSHDGIDRGLALHTYGIGYSKSLASNMASGANTIVLSNASGITVGMRVGDTAFQSFSMDTFVTAVNGNTVTISANANAAISSGSNINFGTDNIHFIGWDATSNTAGQGEFVFTSMTEQPSVINNYLGNLGIGSPINGPKAAIHANAGTFDGIVYSNGGIMPVTGDTLTIGTTGTRWANVISANIGAINGTTTAWTPNTTVTSATTTEFFGRGGNIANLQIENTNLMTWVEVSTNRVGNFKVGTLNSTGNITTGTYVTSPLYRGYFDVASNNQANITALGTLTSLNVDGNITITGTGTVRTDKISAYSGSGSISGQWTLASGATLEATYADLAERHHSDKEYATGTVMTVGGINEVTAASSSSRVLGVVSDQYAYLMNGEAGPQETHPAIAYLGRVPVRVVGPVNKHDRIAPLNDGVAVVSEHNSFAWAIEANEDAGEKLVLCIVK